ncbi:hypothetical protein V1498_02405 [Peribacillus sp. SCS-26]|uniref:hypothetical protein n=1 Tax=Paraperibacillus marinus TaxID=3115295 RepID=UPI0039062225
MIDAIMLAGQVTDKMYEKEPGLLDKFGEQGKKKCREDNHHHFKHLRSTYELDNSKFFTDYAVWLNGILVRHGMETRHLIENFDLISEVLQSPQYSGDKEALAYLGYLSGACEILRSKHNESKEVPTR